MSLTKLQITVIDELVSLTLSEEEILAGHRLSRTRYYRWLDDSDFIAELTRRKAGDVLACQLRLASAAPGAAERLIELSKSKNPETSRKACLDIIASATSAVSGSRADDGGGKSKSALPPIEPETASKLLDVLATAQRASDTGQ